MTVQRHQVDEEDVSAVNSLLGVELLGGWVVVEKVVRPVDSTGGHFSVGYIVENRRGNRGFLKALDFSAAFKQDDPARALEKMTAAFNFERDLLAICKEKGLSRVVTALDSGNHVIAGAPMPNSVQYLLFELADGDVRSRVDQFRALELGWSLRTLHQASVALLQLHQAAIVHQDLKPSNVLTFGNVSKLADLGRALCKNVRAPHEELLFPGDRTYAPPECLYESSGVSPLTHSHRRVVDLYMLGSLGFFLLTGIGATPLLMSKLDPSHHWHKWEDSFDSVLPFLRRAFASSMEELRRSLPGADDRLIAALGQLCDPDPALRGHPKERSRLGHALVTQRYVTLFDLLARSEERRLRTNLAQSA